MIDGYLFGAWLNRGRPDGFKFMYCDEKFAKYLEEYSMNTDLVFVRSVSYIGLMDESRKTNSLWRWITDQKIAKYNKNYGYLIDKRVPDSVHNAPLAYKLDVLSGIFDTTCDRKKFATCNDDLYRDVIRLLDDVGEDYEVKVMKIRREIVIARNKIANRLDA